MNRFFIKRRLFPTISATEHAAAINNLMAWQTRIYAPAKKSARRVVLFFDVEPVLTTTCYYTG